MLPVSKNAGVRVIRRPRPRQRIVRPIFIGAHATPLPVIVNFVGNINVTPEPVLEIPLQADATQDVSNPYKVRVTIGLGVVGRNGSINVNVVRYNPPKKQRLEAKMINIKPLTVL